MAKKMIIDEVYGIVYAIENDVNEKMYIGQTMSHYLSHDTRWARHGIKGRWKYHMENITCGQTELYHDMRKYGKDSFSIFIIRECPGYEINTLDKLETEMIRAYNSLSPHGYNIKLYDCRMTKSKKLLMKHYELDKIEYHKYSVSGTRANTLKGLSLDEKVAFLKSKHITRVRVTWSGQGRVYVKTDENITYQINISRTSDKEAVQKALSIAKQLCSDPSISPDASGILTNVEVYKYQDRLDKLSDMKIRLVTGILYQSNDKKVYTLTFYCKDKRITVSFGGKTQSAKKSYRFATEFVQKLKDSHHDFNIKLKSVE